MKKVFLFLSMIGLALASCTPNDGNGGNEGGDDNILGAKEFTMSVTNIGEIGATLKITPKQEGRTFYWNLATDAELAEYATTAAYMKAAYDYYAALVEGGNATWDQIIDTAPLEYTTDKLNPNTNYNLYAFGIDANGNLTSADITYVKFKTLESTFDHTTWYGYWNATSPKYVSVGVDPFEGSLTEEFVDEPLEKVLAITDASEEFGAGFVYVWGWDGVFELEMPALGLVSSNNIKLMNNTVIFTEDDEDYGPLNYTWSGYSDLTATHGGWYTIGGEYPCYTLTMGADGVATITAYKGQLQDTTPFMTDYYALSAVITTGEYAGYSLGFSRQDGQPATYLSGETMTATYAGPLEEAGTAAKKLSANKKFKLVYKMATPQAAAKKFSAAVNFVK